MSLGCPSGSPLGSCWGVMSFTQIGRKVMEFVSGRPEDLGGLWEGQGLRGSVHRAVGFLGSYQVLRYGDVMGVGEVTGMR